MATDSPTVFDLPFKAGANLSDAQYKGVTMSANDTVKVPTAANDIIIGVMQNKPAAAGRGATVRIAGKTKAKFGATLAAGDLCTLAASGWFADATSGYRACGHVVKGANSGYPGEIIIGSPVTNVSATSVEAGQI